MALFFILLNFGDESITDRQLQNTGMNNGRFVIIIYLKKLR